MPKFGETIPAESTETDVDLRDVMDRPNVEDNSLNKLEDEKMSEEEELVLDWIEKNGIKKGTALDWNGMDALVIEVDFSKKSFSYEITEAGHEEKKTVTFEKLGKGINFLNNFTRVKESE